jgi:hypothetical protein
MKSSWRLTAKDFEFTESIPIIASEIPFFLLIKKILGFAQISFEKQLAATCGFSNECHENPGSLSMNRKKKMKNQMKRAKHTQF